MKKIILVLLTVTILSGAANSRLSCTDSSFPYEWIATSSAVAQASYLSANGYTGVTWNVYQCGAGYCSTVCGFTSGGGPL